MNASSQLAFSPGLRTVFLDRDGVLNQKMPEGQYVTTPHEFRPLPGVIEAIRRMNVAGVRVVVVSNQRGVALGKVSMQAVDEIHALFQDVLRSNGAHVDAIYYCPHDKKSCTCRKPLSGLYDRAVQQFPDITPETSLVIGDSISDVEFGHRIGMRTVFIDGNPEFQKPGAESARQLADRVSSSLLAAVDIILPSAVSSLH